LKSLTAKKKLKKQYKPYITVPRDWTCTESTGPGPFITMAKFKTATNNIVSWSSRHYRKHHFRLDISFGSTWWAPGAIGWWIGVLFAIGATCFALGSAPSYASSVSTFHDNLTYFIGSIFFTSAAFLQYLETSSTPHQFGEKVTEKIHFLIWEPERIDWWSASVQLVGTVFFNISTFAAMLTTLSAIKTELYVWSPDLYGSICFLVSSYLAYSEVGHAFFSFNIRDLSWWIAFLNLMGSVAFGISAVGAFIVLPTSQPFDPFLMNLGTFVGAVCFFLGAILLLPERTRNIKSMNDENPMKY
jgi:hypothetical protein